MQMQIDAIVNDATWKNGDYEKIPARRSDYGFGALILTTPEDCNRKMTRQKVFEEFNKAESDQNASDANDRIRQTQAMMRLDITEKFGNLWERTADAIKARVFIIVARLDHTVTPQPALKLAKLLDAKTLVLEGDCGHLAPSCESPTVNFAVAEFLER